MFKRFKLLTMAALVALSVAACDEGDGTLTPDGTGTIQGRVTVDGAGRAGVVVTLSPSTPARTATTDASGNYSFTDVAIGVYTVSIPAQTGVTFASLTLGATILSDDQTVTADFSGSTVRNSTIVVTVAGSSGPLANVPVALTGAGTGSMNTNASGVASFTGLAAGAYTVTITAPAGNTCAVVTQNTTVGAGETRAVNFTCTAATSGSITGRLFLDENDKNNIFDGATLEDNLMVANVAITLEGPTIGVVTTTQTDASGNFAFTNLPAGQYNVTIDSDDPDLPDNVEYGLASETVGPITLAAGGTAAANFPFDLVEQTILVYAFLGRDANAATNIDPSIPTGIAPVEGVIIDLYPTEEDADDQTNRLARDTTDADGEVQLTFDREDDTSPGVSGPDQIVFARIRNPLPDSMVRNGEAQIEISYDATEAVAMAPDTFDLLNRVATVAVDVVGINGETLEGWRVRLFSDTTAPPIDVALTDSTGRVEFTLDTTVADLPQEFFLKLGTTQVEAGTHAFEAEPTADAGEVVGSFLMFTHTGTVAPGDAVDAGDLTVRFLDTDLLAQVYQERDDTVGFTGGDNTSGSLAIDVTLTWHDVAEDEDSTRTVAALADGSVTFLNVPTGQEGYALSATAPATRIVLDDDSITGIGTGGNLGDLEGGSPETEVCITDEEDCGTFAFKYENDHITGLVRSQDGSARLEDVEVRVRAHPMTIQPNPVDTTLVTNENGRFRVDARSGIYIVSIDDAVVDDNGDTIWAFFGPTEDTVDVEGAADTAIVNFIATKMNTVIQGVVVNDRDLDGNTIDPGEALANVTIELYRDNSGSATVDEDSLVATETTDAAGAYEFTGLREGVYVIRAVSPTNALVLRGYDGDEVIDTAIVETTATPADPADNDNELDRVGSMSPDPLPFWDFASSTASNVFPSHFTFLYSTGTAIAVVEEAGDAVAGMTMTLLRCETAATAPSPPAAGTCLTPFPGAPVVNVNTNSSGRATFTGLLEGVYQVTSNPSTAGYASTVPASMLFTISGNSDVETGEFEAVP